MTACAHRLLPAALAGLLLAAGCGGSAKTPTSPDALSVEPSTAPTPTPSPATGATVSGMVTAGSASGIASATSVGLAGVAVSISGTDLRTTTDGSGRFKLSGVPTGSIQVQFSGAGASGSVQIDDVTELDAVEIDVEVENGILEVQNEERERGSESELEGKIGSVNQGAQSFMVGQTTVVVPPGTEITDGFRMLAFTDLVVGARVHARGSKSGSTLTATEIKVQQSTLDRDEASGAATDLGGACPDRTFRIGSLSVAVNESTIFVKGTCADIVDTVEVEVKGLKRPDGSLLATNLKFEDDRDGNSTDDNGTDNGDATEVEFTGTVGGLGGNCPALTFLAGGRTVTTSDATSFETPCASMADGLKVQVKGTSASGNGPVAASRVKIED